MRPVPSVRQASPGFRRRLRAIDRDAEVHHLGGGQWALVVRKPRWCSEDGNHQRRAAGALIVAEQRKRPVPHWPTLRMGLLMAEGCGLLQMVEVDGPVDLAMVPATDEDGKPGHVPVLEWFRRANWEWRNRRLEQELELLRVVMNNTGTDKARKILAEWARAEGPGIFRHVMQKRRTVDLGRRSAALKRR